MDTSMINLTNRLVDDLFNMKNRYLTDELSYRLREYAIDSLVDEINVRVDIPIWTQLWVEIEDDII